MTKRVILVVFLFLSGLSLALSQKILNKPLSAESQRINKQDIVPQTVIFKVKEGYTDSLQYFLNHKSGLQTLNKKIGIKTLKQSFPRKNPLSNKPNALPGKKDFGIDRIHEIKYRASTDVEQVIAQLKRSHYVEYAEPKYKYQKLYIPTDSLADTTRDNHQRLDKVNAYKGWDEEKGDSSVVIGISDTGVLWEHLDLKDNLKINYAELNGTAGTDDDGNGYVDDSVGWNFENNNPDVSPKDNHGTLVTGIAAATTDNTTGMAGVGFNCSFLPFQVANNNGAISSGVASIENASSFGVDVLNLSWGGVNYSQSTQDIINDAVINDDIVITAAAGNNGSETRFYPASYDNVLSVTGLRRNDTKQGISNYNYRVDVCALGRNVICTNTGGDTNQYTIATGTSMATPMVSGAAGLLRSKFPSWTAQQIMQQIRVTGDNVDTVYKPDFNKTPNDNRQFKEQIGRRLNVYEALTDTTTPAARLVSLSADPSEPRSNDTVKLWGDFVNYRYPTSDLEVTLSTPTSGITIVDSVFSPGTINTLDSASNKSTPFRFHVDKDFPADTRVHFRLGYKDPGTGYTDYQHFFIRINPAYLTIDTNNVALTINHDGRLAFNDPFRNQQGIGFQYKGANQLYEGSLIIGQSSNKLSNCARKRSTLDDDFNTIHNIRFSEIPGHENSIARFEDTSNHNNGLGLDIRQKAYAFNEGGHNQYVIIEYKLKNVSGKALDTLYLGEFMDWDIQPSLFRNKTGWDSLRNMGYAYSTRSNEYLGARLLTEHEPQFYAMDHSNVGGNNINPNDVRFGNGFSDQEKFTTISSGVARTDAGHDSESGNDISYSIGGKIDKIPKGDSATIAFAVMAGNDAYDLKATADNAFKRYNKLNPDTVASVANLEANDISNKKNGEDLQVTFNKIPDESRTKQYRIFAVKASKAASFNLDSANNTPSDHFKAVSPSGTDISTTLGARATDTDGDTIKNGVPYKVFVLTVADGDKAQINNLSEPSDEITLQMATKAVSNVRGEDVGDKKDGRDLEVRFDKIPDESLTKAYRIIVVKASKAQAFNLDSANQISFINYTSIRCYGCRWGYHHQCHSL